MSIRIPVIPYEEQDSFPTPLPPIPEDMNTVDDDYEIYVDHEDDQRIKARPKVNKKEIFIGPDGRPLPEDVQEQIRGYGSEDDTNAFLGSFINDDLIAKTNYGDLKNWEQDILQGGLNSRSGSSWQNELRRLKDMYPGFVPRV